MPTEHIFYIPTVFLLGMIAGRFLPIPRRHAATAARSEAILGWSVVSALLVTVSIFVLTHLFAPFGGVHAVSSAAHGQAVFDQHPVFSASEIYSRLELFGAAGRDAYQAMTYTSDVLFPASLLLTLLLLGAYLSRKGSLSSGVRGWMAVLPIGWFVADISENTMIYRILDAYPEHMTWAPALGAATVIKFALLLSSVLVLAASAWGGTKTKSIV